MKKILRSALVLMLALGGWAVYAMFKEPPPGPMGEQIPPGEAEYTSRIIANGEAMVNAEQKVMPDHIYRRDAHAKTHGCAVASVTVNPVEERFRRGLFATPKEYKAWIRFSAGNTDVESAWKPDARGIALKVLGVPGVKLLPGEEDDRTQDFLMINNPAFFIANVKEYELATHYQAMNSQFTYFGAGEDGQFTWNIFNWRLREFRIGVQILKFPPRDLLGQRYYSMTAYKLGAGQYVKYSAKPVACEAGASVPDGHVPFGGNALRELLTGELGQRSACFDLMVQPQVAGKNMPVEDPTVEWKEADSPFVPVARVRIKQQDIRPQFEAGFCENLSNTPWHALPEHEPVGGLNRVRKPVYLAISHYRHCRNGKMLGEPKDDGSMAFEAKPCPVDATAPPQP